jgi:hypothetical protein
MKGFRDTCIDFFKDENLKQDVKEIVKPIFHMIYNEIYVYLWVIAFYNLFTIILILAMFFILLRLLKNHEVKKRLLAQFVPDVSV